MKSIVLLALVACVAVNGMMPPLAQLAKMATSKSQTGAAGCCLPSNTYQYSMFAVTACWDIHGNAAGFTQAFVQVDLNNMLWYSSQQQVNPAPVESAYEFWFTPGAVSGTWFQFIRVAGQPGCYVQNFTSIPEVFRKPCWTPPEFIYAGDVGVGTHPASIFNGNGQTYNTTIFVDMNQCIPTNDLGFGINGNGDWEEKQSLFFNPQLSVTDPSKFIPPTGCQPIHEAPRLLNGKKFPTSPLVRGAW